MPQIIQRPKEDTDNSVILIKYKIYKSTVGSERKLIGTIDWTQEEWKFQVQEDDEVLAQLNGIQDEGKIVGYESDEIEDGDGVVIADFGQTVFRANDPDFVDALTAQLNLSIGSPTTSYMVSRQAIYEDGIKIGE